MDDTRGAAATLRAQLAMLRIDPDADEFAALLDGFEQARHATAGLYALDGVRYEDPALAFDPRR